MPPPPLPVPDQPTTPRGKTKLDPILHPSTSREGDSTIELAPAETPMIKRNIAMRQAADAAAPPSSTRRTSFERRGRRGSFVGDGFEGECALLILSKEDADLSSIAVPHPSVDDALLHRHINPNELPSTRFLTLISWSAHRQARELASGPASKAREAATRIAEAVLSNISKHGIDVRWADHSGPAAVRAPFTWQWASIDLTIQPSKPTRPLQANEANERNRAKGAALDEWAEACVTTPCASAALVPTFAQHESGTARSKQRQASLCRSQGATTTVGSSCIRLFVIGQLRRLKRSRSRDGRRCPEIRAVVAHDSASGSVTSRDVDKRLG